MTVAFKEYAGLALNKTQKKKPSLIRKLHLAKDRTLKHRQRERTRQKDRGQDR